MSKEKQMEKMYDDGSYVVKKSRKGTIVALVVCFLVAVIIWLYASGTELKEQTQNGNDVNDKELTELSGSVV